MACGLFLFIGGISSFMLPSARQSLKLSSEPLPQPGFCESATATRESQLRGQLLASGDEAQSWYRAGGEWQEPAAPGA